MTREGNCCQGGSCSEVLNIFSVWSFFFKNDIVTSLFVLVDFCFITQTNKQTLMMMSDQGLPTAIKPGTNTEERRLCVCVCVRVCACMWTVNRKPSAF